VERESLILTAVTTTTFFMEKHDPSSGATTLGIMTFITMTFSTTTHGIMGVIVTISVKTLSIINNIQCKTLGMNYF
jgi:hypothetical protein